MQSDHIFGFDSSVLEGSQREEEGGKKRIRNIFSLFGFVLCVFLPLKFLLTREKSTIL